MSDNDVFLEDINHKFDAIMESQAAMSPVPRKLDAIDERLGRVESDVKIIKAVVTDHSAQLNNHDKRLVNLEQN